MSDNLTVKELKRTLTNPIYAITGMVPEDTVIKAMVVMIEQEGPEEFIRSMINSLKSMFDYDANEHAIYLPAFELDEEGNKMWLEYAKRRNRDRG